MSRPQSAALRRPQSAKLSRPSPVVATPERAPESSQSEKDTSFIEETNDISNIDPPSPTAKVATKVSATPSRPQSASMRQERAVVSTVTVPIRELVLSPSHVPPATDTSGSPHKTNAESPNYANRLELKMRIAREAMNQNYKDRVAEIEGRKSLGEKVKELQHDILRLQGVKVPTKAEELMTDRVVLAPKGYGVGDDEVSHLRQFASAANRNSRFMVGNDAQPTERSPQQALTPQRQQLHTTRLDAYSLISDEKAARPSSAFLRRPQASYVASAMGKGVGMDIETMIESTAEYHENVAKTTGRPTTAPTLKSQQVKNDSREYYDEIPVREGDLNANKSVAMDLGDDAFYRHPLLSAEAPNDMTTQSTARRFDPRKDIISLAHMVVSRDVPSIDPWKATHFMPRPWSSVYVTPSLTFENIKHQRRVKEPTGNGLYAVLEVGMNSPAPNLKSLQSAVMSMKSTDDNFGLVDLLMRRHTTLLGTKGTSAQRYDQQSVDISNAHPASPRTLLSKYDSFPDGSSSVIHGKPAPLSRPSSATARSAADNVRNRNVRPATAGPRRPTWPTVSRVSDSSFTPPVRLEENLTVVGNNRTLKSVEKSPLTTEPRRRMDPRTSTRVQPKTVEESMELLENTLRRKQMERDDKSVSTFPQQDLSVTNLQPVQAHTIRVNDDPLLGTANSAAGPNAKTVVSTTTFGTSSDTRNAQQVHSYARPSSAAPLRRQNQVSSRPNSAASARPSSVKGDGGVLLTGSLREPPNRNEIRLGSGFVLYGGAFKR